MTSPCTAAAMASCSATASRKRSRYKHVRPPILAALNILIHDENIALDDAKAQASLRGVWITAASVTAARTLLSRMDAPGATPAKAATTATQRPARRALQLCHILSIEGRRYHQWLPPHAA